MKKLPNYSCFVLVYFENILQWLLSLVLNDQSISQGVMLVDFGVLYK